MEGAEVRRRARARAAYLDLVAGVSDASRLSQIEDLATLLYAVQLALVLFWLQDLSSEVQKTVHLLTFVHDPVARTRPLLRLPWVTQTLAQLVQIIGPLLGRGETYWWSKKQLGEPLLSHPIQSAAVFVAAVADELIEVSALRQHDLDLRAIVIIEL